MIKETENQYKADKGKYFVLTGKGKREHATYRAFYEVGQPVHDSEYDQTYAYIWDIEEGYLEEVPIPGWGTFTGYKVLYNHDGHELSVGNPEIFPTKEIAEGYKRYYESQSWWDKDREIYIKEVEYQRSPLKPCKEYKGKTVYNKDYCYWEALSVGDYVDGEMADNILNAIMPACMRSNCLQLGEPSDYKIDERTGKARETFLTLKQISDDVWEYCGDCFRGENVMRGEEIPHV